MTEKYNDHANEKSREEAKKRWSDWLKEATLSTEMDTEHIEFSVVAESLGLKGRYEYTTDKSKADAIIYYKQRTE